MIPKQYTNVMYKLCLRLLQYTMIKFDLLSIIYLYIKKIWSDCMSIFPDRFFYIFINIIQSPYPPSTNQFPSVQPEVDSFLGLSHPPTWPDQCHVHLQPLGTCYIPFFFELRYILVNRCLYGLSVSLTTWLFRIFAHSACDSQIDFQTRSKRSMRVHKNRYRYRCRYRYRELKWSEWQGRQDQSLRC